MQVTRPRIFIAHDEAQIEACRPVLLQLRPHLAPDAFVRRIRELQVATGFQLACIDDAGIRAVAGYRIGDWLHAGRYLEIEDLVTAADSRSKGYGGQLFDWLVSEALRQSCRQVRLLSGVARIDAHRFYERKGMKAEAYYFSMGVD